MNPTYRKIGGHLQATLRAYTRSTLIIAVVVSLTATAAWPVLRMAAEQSPLDVTRAFLPAMPSADLEAPGSLQTQTPSQTQQSASNALYRFAFGSALAIATLGLLTALSLGGARTSQRLPEFSLRRAMGSSRRFLLGCIAVEGVIVALLATMLVAPLLPAGERWTLARWPGSWGSGSLVTLLVALGIAVAGTILSLLLPYVLAPRPRMSGEISRPLSLWLPVAQIGCSLVILVSGGLMVRHARAQVVPPPATTETAQVIALESALERPARSAQYQRFLARLRDSALIESASLGSHGLRLGLGTVEMVLTDCGDCAIGMIRTRLMPLRVTEYLASPDTFGAHALPVIQGRGLEMTDDSSAPRVALVSRSLAARGFQRGEALGRELKIRTGEPGANPDGEWFTVVGIVDDYTGIGYGTGQQPPMGLFLSVLQLPPRQVELRVAGRQGMQDEIAAAARDSQLAVQGVVMEQDLMLASQGPTRWFGQLFTMLGGALLLIGLIGSVVIMRAWLIALIPELGLRRAMGARRLSLVGLVLGRLGVALMLAGGFAWWVAPGVRLTLSRIVGGDVGSGDPFLAAGLVLLSAGAILGVLAPLMKALSAPPAMLMEHTAE